MLFYELVINEEAKLVEGSPKPKKKVNVKHKV
jgi:hypothetical protein